MKILPIYIAIILSLTPDVILSQILEVNQGTPVFISFENNLPTLGVSLWSSKNDQEIILILDCEDNLKLNPNSNLLIQLVNNQLVNCTYMNLTDAYERIDLKDITYTSWHFKNEPDAIFSIPRHHVETLIKTDVKSFVTYIKKSRVVEKKVYPVTSSNKSKLGLFLIMQGY